MKKSALLLAAVALMVALPACGKKKVLPPPPAPVAPEAPPPAPPPAPREEAAPQVDEYARLKSMTAEQIDKLGLLGDVYFDYDKADIRDSERATLSKNADALKRFDFLRVTVEGHCDERGTVEYNLALGERRAKATKDYMVAAGIAADRIAVISYGKERPFVLGHDEAAWKWNRRSHYVLTAQ